MSTFAELQEKLAAAKAKKSVLEHLSEYIDTHFLPTAGAAPQKLLGHDKLPIQEKYFETVISDILLKQMDELDREIKSIESTTVQPAQAPAAVAPAETQAETPPKTKKKSKKPQQSEPEPAPQVQDAQQGEAQ